MARVNELACMTVVERHASYGIQQLKHDNTCDDMGYYYEQTLWS